MRRLSKLLALAALIVAAVICYKGVVAAAETSSSPLNEQKEISDWVDGCRRDDTRLTDGTATSPQGRTAFLDLEKRFLFVSQRVYNERIALEADLHSDMQWVQFFNFMTFLISLLAACFVSVNANHFKVPEDGASQGKLAPKWFLMLVILLPIFSASLNGYVAVVSPKDDAARLRQKLSSMTAIHKLMAASLASQNCLKGGDSDQNDTSRLAQNLDSWRVLYSALFQSEISPGSKDNGSSNTGGRPP